MKIISQSRRVQKYKRVAKPLNGYALHEDELGDGPGAGLRVRLYSWTRRVSTKNRLDSSDFFGGVKNG